MFVIVPLICVLLPSVAGLAAFVGRPSTQSVASGSLVSFKDALENRSVSEIIITRNYSISNQLDGYSSSPLRVDRCAAAGCLQCRHQGPLIRLQHCSPRFRAMHLSARVQATYGGQLHASCCSQPRLACDV